MIITESRAVLHRWPVHQPAMSKAAQKRSQRKLKKEIGWAEFQLESQTYTGTEGQHTNLPLLCNNLNTRLQAVPHIPHCVWSMCLHDSTQAPSSDKWCTQQSSHGRYSQ